MFVTVDCKDDKRMLGTLKMETDFGRPRCRSRAFHSQRMEPFWLHARHDTQTDQSFGAKASFSE